MFRPTITKNKAVRGLGKIVLPPILRLTSGRRSSPVPMIFQKNCQPLILRRCLTESNHRRSAGFPKEGQPDGLKKTSKEAIREESEETLVQHRPWPWRTLIAFGVFLAGASIYGFKTNNQSDPPQKTQSGSIEWMGKAVPPFTLDDVNAWLNQETTSWRPDHWLYSYRRDGRPLGVERCDGIRLKSNDPCEDQMVISVQNVEGSKKKWMFWGVFDGHNGSAMSLTLKESLIPHVVRNISQLYRSFSGEKPPPSTVDIAISSAFRQLDSDIMEDGIKALSSGGTFTETISRLAPYFAGSCAILSMYDPNTQILRTACTGDSRAVLGRRTSSGTYAAEPLSVDQTGFNALELERITKEHPGETDIVGLKDGRVLGIAVSRAFGDGLWKWPIEVVNECKEKYFWKPVRPGYKSPPYLTAEPVITSTKIEGGEFLILASDGLWDCITNEQAIKFVELWLVAKKKGKIGKADKLVSTKKVRKDIWEKAVEEEDFVLEDENCAAHLVRNAFGGRDRARLLGMAGAQPPYSRNVRDDVTVQVIFFKGVDV